jgi:hypothetical protein
MDVAIGDALDLRVVARRDVLNIVARLFQDPSQDVGVEVLACGALHRNFDWCVALRHICSSRTNQCGQGDGSRRTQSQ